MSLPDRQPPRRRIAIGNWKMNKTVSEAVSFVREVSGALSGDHGIEIWVAPPFTALAAVAAALEGTRVGVAAQNLFWEERGAYTGEVSPSQLAEAGARAVLIGHSERRSLFGETDEGVARKLRAALDHELMPVVCIGETLDQRTAGDMEAVISSQIAKGLEGGTPVPAGRLVMAYEPVWAIGTGRVATAGQIAEVHRLIRDRVSAILGAEASGTPILYGGSVTPDNIVELAGIDELDGVLVGGASLKSDSFARIVRGLAGAAEIK